MKIMRAWQKQADGTLRLEDIGWNLQAGDAWGLCKDAKPEPTTEDRWLDEFGHMIAAAAKVDECISDPRCRRHLGDERRCPVRAMLGWTIRCRKIIGQIADPLKMARLQLPTPPEFKGTIAEPYCELAIQLVEMRCVWLQRNFVTHTNESIRLPIDERVADEAAKIVSQWDEVAKRWKFDAIHVEEWMRLISLELANTDWSPADDQDEDKWSEYRSPKKWRILRNKANLSHSARTWGNLRKRHIDAMQGAPGSDCKAVRIRRSLVVEWGIVLPEFTVPAER